MQIQAIPRSWRKMWSTIALGLLMAVGGLWLFRTANQFEELWFQIVAYVVAVAGILFFGGGALVIIRFMSSGRPALIFESDGFIDETSLSAVGKVYWRDVTGLRKRGAFLVGDLDNPATYFPEESSGLKRWLIKGNLRRFDTPVVLSAQTVALSLDELTARMEKHRQEYEQTQ